MLKEYTRSIPNVETNEQKLRVTISRPGVGDVITIQLWGAENPGSLKGTYLDGVILDEFSEMDPIIWREVVRPMLSDRLGWACFIGTPKGRNALKELFDYAGTEPSNWFRAIFKASETGIIPESELREARATMSEELYNQEYECDFTAAIVGAYYAKYINRAISEGRVTTLGYDQALMVDTFWDIGVSDTTAIWFIQQFGKEIRVIDYLENSGEGLDWYVGQLRKKGYSYGEHVLPHDANSRDIGTGITRVQQLRQYGMDGLGRIRVLEKTVVEDGINAVRVLLDRCWFDRKKCERGIEALLNYQQKWDSKNQIFSSQALHNWASHGADAFRTFAMGMKDPVARHKDKFLPERAENNWDPLA